MLQSTGCLLSHPYKDFSVGGRMEEAQIKPARECTCQMKRMQIRTRAFSFYSLSAGWWSSENTCWKGQNYWSALKGRAVLVGRERVPKNTAIIPFFSQKGKKRKCLFPFYSASQRLCEFVIRTIEVAPNLPNSSLAVSYPWSVSRGVEWWIWDLVGIINASVPRRGPRLALVPAWAIKPYISHVSDYKHRCFVIFCLLLGTPACLQGLVRKIRGAESWWEGGRAQRSLPFDILGAFIPFFL